MPDDFVSFDPSQGCADYSSAFTLPTDPADAVRKCLYVADGLGLKLRSKTETQLDFREVFRWWGRPLDLHVETTSARHGTRMWVYGSSSGKRKLVSETSYVRTLVSAFVSRVVAETEESTVSGSGPSGRRTGRRKWQKPLTLLQQVSVPLCALGMIVGIRMHSIAGAIVIIAAWLIFANGACIGEFVRRRLLGLNSENTLAFLIIGLAFYAALVAVGVWYGVTHW